MTRDQAIEVAIEVLDEKLDSVEGSDRAKLQAAMRILSQMQFEITALPLFIGEE